MKNEPPVEFVKPETPEPEEFSIVNPLPIILIMGLIVFGVSLYLRSKTSTKFNPLGGHTRCECVTIDQSLKPIKGGKSYTWFNFPRESK